MSLFYGICGTLKQRLTYGSTFHSKCLVALGKNLAQFSVYEKVKLFATFTNVLPTPAQELFPFRSKLYAPDSYDRIRPEPNV